MYTVADIIRLHMYHCIDCLAEGHYDCGCADAARDQVREEMSAPYTPSSELERIWAEHVAWAIKEYAE